MPSKKKGKKKKGKKAKEVVTYGMWLNGVLKDQEKEREKDPEGPKTPNNDEFLLRLMNTDNSKGQEVFSFHVDPLRLPPRNFLCFFRVQPDPGLDADARPG